MKSSTPIMQMVRDAKALSSRSKRAAGDGDERWLVATGCWVNWRCPFGVENDVGPISENIWEWRLCGKILEPI
jgi:hypothetical protein